MLPGQARGWSATAGVAAGLAPRDGKAMVLYGNCDCIGWACVEVGHPPPQVLPLVGRQ